MDPLATRVNLQKRGVEDDYLLFPVCDLYLETIDRVLVSCYVTTSMWNLVAI